MAALKRESPPPVAGNTKTTNWREIFEDLRSTPWEWAIAGEAFPASYVTQIKNGRFAGSAKGEFEATMRSTDTSTQKGRLYVRYIGVPKPDHVEDVKP